MECNLSAVMSFSRVLALLVNMINVGPCFAFSPIVGHECGEVKQRAVGMIKSPRLPASYSRAVLCRWKIIAPKDYNEIDIYLWLNGARKLTYDLTHCFSDHLAINQIIDGRKEKRAKFCGKNGFFRTKTFGREAEVRFWASPTRDDNGRTSFRLLWFASKGCSSIIHGQQGIIQSPNYPYDYPSDTFCTWRITTPFKAGIIKVRFIKFDLQGQPPLCRKDYLIVKTANKTVGIFCGKDTVEELNIEGDTAILIFKSNKKKNFPGFRIEWSAEYHETKSLTCGHSNFPPQPFHHRQKRFVGGRRARRGNIPWLAQVVSTQYTKTPSHIREMSCGGALIGDKWILTAAHCVLPSKKTKHMVYLGGLVSKDLTARKVGVKQVFIHPGYMGMLTNDVALLELNERLDQSYAVKQVCLPDSRAAKNLFHFKTKCWMAGWGRRKNGNFSSSLYYSELKYLGHCLLRPDVVCARSPNARRKIGPCDGDSGGPLFCQANGGRFVVTGILTHGPKICGTKQDYYANISYYHKWIKEIMQANEIVNNNTE